LSDQVANEGRAIGFTAFASAACEYAVFCAQMKRTAAINILGHFLRNLFRAWVEIAIAFNCSKDFVLALFRLAAMRKK
jgi:hypothetical protein